MNNTNISQFPVYDKPDILLLLGMIIKEAVQDTRFLINVDPELLYREQHLAADFNST